MNDCYSRVTNLARLCCQHLYSYDQDAPHSDRLSVTFDAQELGKALHDGRKAIQPLIDDFVKASAPITLKTGGKGVRFCDTPAKCAHGCAFEIAERLLLAIENKTDKTFVRHSSDGGIRTLWGAISHEAADIVNRNAATCDDEAEATPAESDDALPKSKRADSPSRVKARAAYDYAMERIPNASFMTVPELFDAIKKDGEAAEMLPPTAESFTKYLNDCGIRLKKGGPKATGGSVVRRSDL